MDKVAYSRKQELANSITHGAGIILSLIGIPFLCWVVADFQLSALSWTTLGLYWFSLLMVYINSTFYHALKKPEIKKTFKVLDHISIYLLIAATTTFFVLRYVSGSAGIIFVIIQWILVLAGIIFKIFFTGRFKLLSTFLYVGLGLMVLFISQSLWANMPGAVFAWIWTGGALYAAGTVFYLWKKPYFQHAIWHLFVLAGSISHYIALLYSLQPVAMAGS